MIEQRDLDAAVGAGIVDATTAARLVAFARAHRRGEAGPDEEAFRLLTGFNDIFVTIAIGLLLFALGTLGGRMVPALGAMLVAAASWGLAEYFTRQRRLALPSIALLLAFVGGVFTAGVGIFGTIDRGGAVRAVQFATVGMRDTNGASGMIGVAVAAAIAALAAYLHWRRFHVPITVAAGAGAVAGGILALVSTRNVLSNDATLAIILLAGLAIFALAMVFDARDRARVTRRSDVAFWLHLLAAPMIVHPVFALAGLLHGDPAPGAAVAVVAVYAALTLVALAIDRRALLVSALFYVIYAIQGLLAAGGAVDTSLALTALVIGGFLVLLSAAWRSIRVRVLRLLPLILTARLPVATA